jgi:hypothetical protein
MKRSFVLLFLGLLGTLPGCRKMETIDKDSHFIAVKGRDEWQATTVYAHYSSGSETFVVSGSQRHKKYYQDEQIRFSFKSGAIGSSGTVTSFESEFMDIVGGDGIANSFASSAGDPGNILTITGIDTVNHVLEGKFELRLKRNPHWTREAEYLEFRNGKFKVNYIQAP